FDRPPGSAGNPATHSGATCTSWLWSVQHFQSLQSPRRAKRYRQQPFRPVLQPTWPHLSRKARFGVLDMKMAMNSVILTLSIVVLTARLGIAQTNEVLPTADEVVARMIKLDARGKTLSMGVQPTCCR